MSQTKPHPSVPPPPAKSNGEYFPRVFHVVIPDPPNWDAKMTRHSGWQILGKRAGWSAVWYNSLTGWYFSAKFKLKMDSNVLLLSYLDKIGLILTGEAGQALAYLHSEARLYKGARMAPLSQSTTTRSTGNISVGEESRPLQHMWNSKGFVLSRSNLLLHNSLHFQHLLKSKG